MCPRRLFCPRARLPGPEPAFWRGDRAAAASRGLPQAVFKISSFNHGGGAVSGRVAYISREDELELEGPGGALFDLDEAAARARERTRRCSSGS